MGEDGGRSTVKARPLIGAIGERFLEKGEQIEQRRQERETAVAILNVGGGDGTVYEQAFGIDRNMALLALDRLARIEAVGINARPLFHRFSYYPTFCPAGTSLAELAGVAGLRWAVEECFQRAKDDLVSIAARRGPGMAGTAI